MSGGRRQATPRARRTAGENDNTRREEWARERQKEEQ